jgi:6-phosphogluconate dehydrogenase
VPRYRDVYEQWNQTELGSYLLEILAPILRRMVEETPGTPLVDMILDQARQKGTGMWMSQDAMALQVPTPTIDAAVMMRNLSVFGSERQAASDALRGPGAQFEGEREAIFTRLKNALYAGMLLTYAQGLTLLDKASRAYDYGLDLEAVARIWRGGCIIRAALLERIRTVWHRPIDPPGSSWPGNCRAPGGLAPDRRDRSRAWLPAPGLMASLAYFDAYRGSAPDNLIQAQRDYFGPHLRARRRPGVFHTA